MGGDKKKDNEKIDVLFDNAQIIELQKEADGSVKPFVSFKCPQIFEDDSSGASKAVPQFCFPDIGRFPCDDLESEFFSFVLTESDGDRRFGYCLRKLPPGHGKRFPVAYAVLSFFPCFTLYTKILEQIAFHYENSSLSKLNGFLTSVLDNRFPQPGESFVVKTANESGSFDNWNFTRPDDSDSLLDHADLETLLTVLTPHNVLTVFVGMLVERRIIFCSSKLSILSSCVQTAVALLYPFVWQHIYIPVLPKTLLSFCCAPMPFVVGILASSLDEVLGLPMDEVLLIDLDQNGFLLVPDANRGDAELLTSEQYESLTKVLKATSKLFKTIQKKKKRLTNLEDDKLTINQLDYESKRQKNLLKEMFLKFFVQIVGDYRQFINLESKSFDRESFIAQQPPELQSLIEMLVMSQMFERFIEERIHSEKPNNGQFEAQIKLQKKVDLFSQQLSDAVSSSSGSSRQSNRKNDIFSSLRRGVFGRDSAVPAPNDFNLVISDPKLVKSTNEVTTSSNSPLAMSSPSAPSSSLAAVLNSKPPPPPPKPKGALPPRMVIPTKALPTPPKQTSPSHLAFDSSPPSSPPVHPPLGSSPSSSSSSSYIPQKSGSTGQIFDSSLLAPLPSSTSTPETPSSPNTAPRGRGRGRGGPLRPGGPGPRGGGGGINSPRQMGSFEDDSGLLAGSSQPPITKPRSQTTTNPSSQNSSAPSPSPSPDHSSLGANAGGTSPAPVLRERPARPPQNRNAVCSSVPAAIAPVNPSGPSPAGAGPSNGFASRPTPTVAPRPKPRPAPTGPPSGFQSRPTPSLPSSAVAPTVAPAPSPAPPPATRSPPSPDPSSLSSSSAPAPSTSPSGGMPQIPQIPPRTEASRRGPAPTPSPVGRPLPKPTPNPSSPL